MLKQLYQIASRNGGQLLNTISVRAQSSQAAAAATKEPLRLYDRPGRYATALWQAAAEKQQLPMVQKDMTTFKALTILPEFVFYLNDPSTLKVDKLNFLGEILNKMGAAEMTKKLCTILGENNRLRDLPGISKSFELLQNDAQGAKEATVVTARAIDTKEKNAIKKGLEEYSGGSGLTIQWKVDQRLVGGMVAYIGDVYVDMSVASIINQAEDIIMDAQLTPSK